VLLGCAAFVVIVAGLKTAQSLVLPLRLSAFLAIVCGSAVRWLQNRGAPPLMALLIVISTSTVVLLFVTALVVASVNDFAGKIPDLQASLDEKKDAAAWLVEKGVPIDPTFNKQVFVLNGLTRLFTQLLVGLSSAFSNIFLVLLLLIFILLQASTYSAKLLAISVDSGETLERARMIQEAIMN
jgi:predicted PurR-regulated permease PerM